LQAACGMMIVFFTYQTARMVFTIPVALVAGLLIMIHPYLVKLTMQVIDTGFSVALTALGMRCFVGAWIRPTAPFGRYGVAGAVMALATLARPVGAIHTLALGVAIVVRLSFRQRSRSLMTAAVIFGLTWAVVMSPWWVYNYVRYGSFIVLTTHGGLALLTGHTPYYTRVHPTYDTDWFPYVPLPAKPPNDPTGSLYSKVFIQQAVAYLRDQPLTVIATDLKKIVWLYSWHKVPRSLVDSHPRWDPRSHTVIQDGNPKAAPQDLIYSAYWVPVLVLGIVGIWRSRHQWLRLLPIYFLIVANAFTTTLTCPDTRYRLEVDPYIAMWAAYGLWGLVVWASERLRRRELPAAAA